MKFKAWPFLVSRNRTSGYKVIVAPNFMVESGQSGLLVNLVVSEPTQKLIYREVNLPTLGSMSLVYRVVYAIENGNLLNDEFGRPILWIEGLVFREKVENYDVTGELLDKVRLYTKNAFQEFWALDKFATKASEDLEIYLQQATVSSHIRKIEQPIDETCLDWTTDNKENLRYRYTELRQERKGADRNYKIGLVCSLVGIPLVPVFGIGLVLIPVGGVIAFLNHKKLVQLDEQIKIIENKLRR